MSGLGLVFSIARDALAAQQNGIDVTAHNVANVDTPGYCRQRAVHEAKEPAPYGGLMFGRGVDTAQVLRISDQFIENRLMRQNSNMLSYKEMENYMQVLEGVFSEDSETSVSSLMADFWNLWHDVANNPSGTSERIALYEHSISVAQQFKSLSRDFGDIETDLTQAVSSGINRINEITAEIADVNAEVVRSESGAIANDMRDKRNALVSELAGYIDVKTFEQSNGSLSIITARGCVLVQGNESYDLDLGGDNGDRVQWSGSGGSAVDITNYINTGKLGGWLDMRDEIAAKYKSDLDALARELIWTVNQQHSLGVGLEAFSSVKGSYAVSDSSKELGSEDCGLEYYDKLSNGTFNLWVYDSGGNVVNGVPTSIMIDAGTGGTTLTSLAAQIDAIDDISASVTSDGKLRIDADSGYTFAFSDDTSNVLAAIGINTFFTGVGAGTIGLSDVITSDKNYISAAQIHSDGSIAAGDNKNALAIADLQYKLVDIAQWTCDRRNGNTQGCIRTTIEDYYHALVGSMGITSASVSRGRSFNEGMVNKLRELRDSISAVSLDEEMTNLIKYQHAYAAAAKLITASDEMLETLLETK
ncbi:MAG: flagellar hook-associated protein FlgK [Deltaproteobacteria bacterium]|nr:flagellar hook-associated protein FlgK [Deltaproteobacteria bacterium]